MQAKSPYTSIGALVDGGGFEPPKQSATDLQSVPFGHSGTPPHVPQSPARSQAFVQLLVELAMGLEPATP